MKTDHRITINLNERQYNALNYACEVTGMSYCQYIRTLLNVLASQKEQQDAKFENTVKEAVRDANVKDTGSNQL